ncbi:protein TBATA-like isoform X2 [Tubulanus polymorphus]|uniref:protein TBATA-like isoform X2 n=1 Tax=Tubulanus polymorphus TaxID=672921 RepID=UPI003DA3365A
MAYVANGHFRTWYNEDPNLSYVQVRRLPLNQMSQSEVFRPSEAPLMIRSSLQEGINMPFHSKSGSRPSTQGSGGYRFGQRSLNSFFTRHNPHPNRVTHIKGLLDIPICAVNDDGYMANPRYSLQLPPKQFTPQHRPRDIPRIPVNAGHIGKTKLHPINTVTGMQNWTGLQNYPWRERAVPRVGLVPVTESWRDELREFTEKALIPPPSPEKQKPRTQDNERHTKTQYSANTGRLIPPASRAMSRGRTGTRHKFRRELEHIIEEGNMETMVLTMLCQILQVEDLNAVQAWLCSAGDIEKNMALDLVRAALNQEDAGTHEVPEELLEKPATALPGENWTTQNGDEPTNKEQDEFIEKIVERLSIADGRFSRQRVTRDENGDLRTTSIEPLPEILKKPDPIPAENNARPPTSQVFKTATSSGPPGTAKSGPKLRMTNGSRPTTQCMLADENKAWNPTEATV